MPLRKGSKSIKNKNFKSFYKKPLFCWYLDAIIKSETASEIWIATDSKHIEKITKENYHQINVYRRKKENAADTSPSIDVVLEFLEKYRFEDNDNFILVQATSPLTSPADLIKLKNAIINTDNDSFISCVRLKRFRWSEDGTPLDYDLQHKPRRQDYKGFLVESGAFYCSTVKNILNSKSLISGKIGVIELDNEAVIDIDEPIDWKLGELYLRQIMKASHE